VSDNLIQAALAIFNIFFMIRLLRKIREKDRELAAITKKHGTKEEIKAQIAANMEKIAAIEAEIYALLAEAKEEECWHA
jgi:hypothetical protein